MHLRRRAISWTATLRSRSMFRLWRGAALMSPAHFSAQVPYQRTVRRPMPIITRRIGAPRRFCARGRRRHATPAWLSAARHSARSVTLHRDRRRDAVTIPPARPPRASRSFRRASACWSTRPAAPWSRSDRFGPVPGSAFERGGGGTPGADRPGIEQDRRSRSRLRACTIEPWQSPFPQCSSPSTTPTPHSCSTATRSASRSATTSGPATSRWVTVGAPGQNVDIVLSQPHGGRSQAEGDALLSLVTQGSTAGGDLPRRRPRRNIREGAGGGRRGAPGADVATLGSARLCVSRPFGQPRPHRPGLTCMDVTTEC